VRGGKGDDQIGRELKVLRGEMGAPTPILEAEYVQNEDGIDGIRRVPIGEAFDVRFPATQSKEALYGEQGDDLMYGGPVIGS